MMSELRRAVTMLIAMTLITGVVYPLFVTAISQAAFRGKATGSLIERDGNVVGSELIGQPFADPKHFWSRASATSPYPYNASSSSGSNLGPSNRALADAVSGRVKALRDAAPGSDGPVPVDLVTASASGLDPHISPAAAAYQVERVAKARNLDAEKVRALVAEYTEGRQLGFLGEPRVNVLRLNLALDALR
ncbi:MAG: potassium-transporting ATPase subunit KdpC [Betaproteobacteria bacterium]